MPKLDLRMTGVLAAAIAIVAFLLVESRTSEVGSNVVTSKQMSEICTPSTRPCLKYEITQLRPVAGSDYSTVCMNTKATENGVAGNTVRFSSGCQPTSASCARCKVGQEHTVAFSVLADYSKAGVNQSITIGFPVTGERSTHSPSRAVASVQSASADEITAEEIFEMNQQLDDLALTQETERSAD